VRVLKIATDRFEHDIRDDRVAAHVDVAARVDV